MGAAVAAWLSESRRSQHHYALVSAIDGTSERRKDCLAFRSTTL